MTNIGSPDYQRGVVNAQVLLYSGSFTGIAPTVGIPPNVETIVLIVPTSSPNQEVAVQGTTTEYIYPSTTVQPASGTSPFTTYYIDVSPTVDPEITFVGTPLRETTMIVYADAAAHIVVDPSKVTNQEGALYVVSTVPNTASGDHPSNELLVVSNVNVADNGVVLGAAGAGKRYRAFYVTIINQSASVGVAILDTVTGIYLAQAGFGAAGVPGVTDFKPSGYPLAANAGVKIVTGGGDAAYVMVYTLETI